MQRALNHLKRLILTLGLAVTITVIVGLALANWLGGELAENPITHAILAVVSVFPALLALVTVPIVASRFIKEFYDVPSLEEAHDFLMRLVYGVVKFGPSLLIKEGKVAKGKDSPLHRVGGPGYLVIYNDSAVVTERGGRLWRILGTGFAKLERFEKVYEVIDLRPQRWVLPVRGMTREGIPVICEADVHFKIDDRIPDERGTLRRQQPTQKEPYPYNPDAILRAISHRWVREPGSTAPTMDWAGRVIVSFVEGTLRNILAEYRLDWLIAPIGSTDEHPREVIRRRLEEQMKQKAANVGGMILRLELGEIKVEDERISKQWIDAWYADWQSRSLASRVEGEAQLLRMEVAQAQAQAEMVIRLTDALQSVVTDEEDLRPYLLATRFVQTLHWLAFDPSTRGFMPPEATQTLENLQRMLGEGDASPSSGATDIKQPEEGT